MSGRMKRILLSFLFLLVASSITYGGEKEVPKTDGRAENFRFMSFNIRTLDPTDGLDFWFFRRDHVADLIIRNLPDSVGMQEVFTIQARGLEKRLPQYDWLGVGRGDGEDKGERCPIFYRTDRLKLLDHDTFWLSETPDEPSRSWDSSLKRIVTWARFRDIETGEVFYHFNTHFDHVGVVARRRSAEILVDKVKDIAGGAPVVVTGDFNTTDDTRPYQTMTGLLLDSRLASLTAPSGPEGTSRSFRRDSKPKKRIDYVFLSEGIKALSYSVLEDTYRNNRRPSDHMPVLVNVKLPDDD